MKNVFIILSVIFTLTSNASITCTTPHLSKKIVIKNNNVVISNPLLKEVSDRALASSSSIRTKILKNGFEKIVFIHGNKNVIHIENKNHFSDNDDYLLIKNKSGHEMIYPLLCE